jgi:hypothetical protein
MSGGTRFASLERTTAIKTRFEIQIEREAALA